MKNFNLTEWALRHKELVYFFVVLMFAGGIFSYQKLGRMEDPDFTIRTMVVSVAWPGGVSARSGRTGHRQDRKKTAGFAGSGLFEKLLQAGAGDHLCEPERGYGKGSPGAASLAGSPQHGERHQGDLSRGSHRALFQRPVR